MTAIIYEYTMDRRKSMLHDIAPVRVSVMSNVISVQDYIDGNNIRWIRLTTTDKVETYRDFYCKVEISF